MKNLKKFTQKDRYGNMFSFEFDVPPMGEGVPVPQGHPGAMPVGTDTVPAMLTPGEFVMNAEATRKFKPQLEKMNNQGRAIQRAQGGSIPTQGVPPTPQVQTMNFLSEGGQPKTGWDALLDALGYGSALPQNQTPSQQKERQQAVDTSPMGSLGDVSSPYQGQTGRDPMQKNVPVNTSDMNNPQAATPKQEAMAAAPEDLEAQISAQLDAQGEEQVPEGTVVRPGETVPKEDWKKSDKVNDALNTTVNSTESLDAELEAAMNEEEALKTGQIQMAKRTDQGQVAMNGIKNFLKEWGIADLFDKQEVGRMAALYLGSRVLGHTHSGSLNWAAKQYLKRVDGKVAAHGKRVQDLLDSGDYTKESVAKYKESRDINDLQKAGISYTPTGKTEFRMYPVQGENGKITYRKLQLREVKGSDGGTYFQTRQGQVVDPMNTMPYKPENDPNMDEYHVKNSRITSDLKTSMEEKLKLFDQERGFGGKDQDNRPIGFTADDASKQFVVFARENGLDPDSTYVQAMASNALQQAYADAARGTKATEYAPYLTQQYIRETTGANDHLQTGTDEFGRPTYIRTDLVTRLNDDLVATAMQRRNSKGLPEKSPTWIRQKMYESAMESWTKLGKEGQKQWNSMASDGETTGFYEYMREKLLDFRTYKE